MKLILCIHVSFTQMDPVKFLIITEDHNSLFLKLVALLDFNSEKSLDGVYRLYISRIDLRNFRNFRKSSFHFTDGVNTLIGETDLVKPMYFMQ
jgi:hypothetical protein